MKNNKNRVFPEQKQLKSFNFFEPLVFNLEKFKRLRKFKKSKIHLTGGSFFWSFLSESYCKSPEIGERNDGDGAVKGDSGCS